jgi:hypothetical protein
MSKREVIRKELLALYDEGGKLAVAFQKKEEKQFHYTMTINDGTPRP